MKASRLKKDRLERYSLTDAERKVIFSHVVEVKDIGTSRRKEFTERIENTYPDLPRAEIMAIWDALNRYIFQSFLDEGRDAVARFMPYKAEPLHINSRTERFREIYTSLDENLVPILKKCITSYPETIGAKELKFLSSLADKADKFYSLGVPPDLADEATALLPLKTMCYLDTNVLVSVLEIGQNVEKDAIRQITSYAQTHDHVELRYFPISRDELGRVRSEIEGSQQSVEFTPSQIRAALESDLLDDYTRAYYEAKLNGEDRLHPIYVMRQSTEIFGSRSVKLYNQRFQFYEDTDYISALVSRYYDFESIVNNARAARNLPPRVKQKGQAEHDVKLRESIIHLRQKLKDDTLHIGITLDKKLVKYDLSESRRPQYRDREKSFPVFLTPANFLRRFRAFLPIEAEDYQRAFLAAVTILPSKSGTPEQSKKIFKNAISLSQTRHL